MPPSPDLHRPPLLSPSRFFSPAQPLAGWRLVLTVAGATVAVALLLAGLAFVGVLAFWWYEFSQWGNNK